MVTVDASGGAVIPVIEFSSCRAALGGTVRVRALAEHAGQFEDGLALLPDLDRRWGPAGELAALAAAAPGTPVAVSWETVLLVSLGDVGGVELDVANGTATRNGAVTAPGDAVRRRLAAQLLAQELRDAGCVAVEVAIIAACAAAGDGVAWSNAASPGGKLSPAGSRSRDRRRPATSRGPVPAGWRCR